MSKQELQLDQDKEIDKNMAVDSLKNATQDNTSDLEVEIEEEEGVTSGESEDEISGDDNNFAKSAEEGSSAAYDTSMSQAGEVEKIEEL